MAKIRHAKTLSDALKACDHAILLAPASALGAGLPKLLFKGKAGQLATALSEGLEPGPPRWYAACDPRHRNRKNAYSPSNHRGRVLSPGGSSPNGGVVSADASARHVRSAALHPR